MKIAFLTITKGEVLDSEIVEISDEFDCVNRLRKCRTTKLSVKDNYCLPDGEYKVYNITSRHIDKVVKLLTEPEFESSHPKRMVEFLDAVDIIERDYFDGMVIY